MASDPPNSRPSPPGTAAAALLMVVGAAAFGLYASTRPRIALLSWMLVGLVAGVALTIVAARHFWAFLLVLFAVRTSLDAFKEGGGSSGLLSPTVLVGGMFLVAATSWLVQQRRLGRFGPVSRSARAMFAVSAACFLSVIGSKFPVTSFQASFRVLSSAVMLLVLEQAFAQRPARVRGLMIAVVVSLVVPALFGIVQLVGNQQVQPEYGPKLPVGRILGTFVHPNAFATYLVVLIPLTIAMLPVYHGRPRTVLLGVAGLSCALLMFTYARGAWLGAIIAVIAVGFLQDRRIVTGLLCALVAVVLFVPSVSARLSDLGSSQKANVDDPNSLSWRMKYWGSVLPMAGESPVTGIGLQNVELRTTAGLPPHNVFVQAFVETGVFGLCALLALVGCLIADLRRALRRARPGFDRCIVVAAIGVGMGLLVQTASENLLTQVVSHWYFLFPIAYATALGNSPDAFVERDADRPFVLVR
ncbi:MAG: O-antigen ligase family protein [Acidimicrobiia bacterium]